jgi:hypothetical protein
MKESSDRPNSSGWIASLLEADFNLPDSEDFQSVSLPMTYAQFLELSERHLPAYNSNPAVQQARLEQKKNDPFVLFD